MQSFLCRVLALLFALNCILPTPSAWAQARRKTKAPQPSCNITAMLNNAQDKQWRNPDCVNNVADLTQQNKLNVQQQNQLKNVLWSALNSAQNWYNSLSDENQQKNGTYYHHLLKSFDRMADKGYGIGRDSSYKVGLTKSGKVVTYSVGEAIDQTLQQAKTSPQVGLSQKGSGNNTFSRNEKRNASQVSRADTEVNTPETPEKQTAIPTTQLQSVFPENGAELKEEDSPININILNQMLSNGKDFSPLLDFIGKKASFDPNSTDYVPPRFARLALAYYAESLPPTSGSKLAVYVQNKDYSENFRFLAATVSAAYALNQKTNDSYQGKFRYSPHDADAIITYLLQGKAGSSDENKIQIDNWISKVRPYASPDILSIGPTQANGSAATAVALAATENMATIGEGSVLFSVVALTAGLAGASYEVYQAFAPIYQRRFKETLLQQTFDVALQGTGEHSLKDAVETFPALDSWGEPLSMFVTVWDEYTMAKIGTFATTGTKTKRKKPVTCIYDDKVNKDIHIPLSVLGALLNPGDKSTRERAKFLHRCLVKTGYCPALTTKQENSGMSSWFSNCKNTPVRKVKVPAKCQADLRNLGLVLEQHRSFKDSVKGKTLYARAIYYENKWIVEAEIGLLTNDPLVNFLSDQLMAVIMNNGKLRKTSIPDKIAPSTIYRNGGHEDIARYDFQQNPQEMVRKKKAPFKHFHYERITPYTYTTYQGQRNKGVYKCNNSIFYNLKINPYQ